jgi:hypothetical protein
VYNSNAAAGRRRGDVRREERIAALEALLARIRANAVVRELPAPIATAGHDTDPAPAPAVSRGPSRRAPAPTEADLGGLGSLLERDLRDPSPPRTPLPPDAIEFAPIDPEEPWVDDPPPPDLAPLHSRPPPPPPALEEPPRSRTLALFEGIDEPPPSIPRPPPLPTGAGVNDSGRGPPPTTVVELGPVDVDDSGPASDGRRRGFAPPPSTSVDLVDGGAGSASSARDRAPPSLRDERPPDSELERAIREAAYPVATPDPRLLWEGAAQDLKERRQTAPPPKIEPPPMPAPPASAPRSRRPPASRPSAPPSSHERRRSGRKTGSRGRAAAALFLVGALGAAVYAATDRSGDEAEPRSPSAPTSTAPAAPTPRAAPSSVPSVRFTGPSPVEREVLPPPLRQPHDHGQLWIDSPVEVDVYLQGLRIGRDGVWLEVPCGQRNVRLARPGAAPPGHTFPLWLGEGMPVSIPCGRTIRVRWKPD